MPKLSKLDTYFELSCDQWDLQNLTLLCVSGQVIETEDGNEQFIPGQVMEQTTTDGDVVKKFVPGQVIETLKSGPAFIPGQVVQTDGGLKFVPGEIVVMSNGSALFVPGQVIDSPSGNWKKFTRFLTTLK